MEDKKYEVGRVEISSAEYRDLVTEAVEARKDASEKRSENWKLESEKRKLEEKLKSANKRVAELESILANLRTDIRHNYTTDSTATPYKPLLPEVTCLSNSKEDNQLWHHSTK